MHTQPNLKSNKPACVLETYKYVPTNNTKYIPSKIPPRVYWNKNSKVKFCKHNTSSKIKWSPCCTDLPQIHESVVIFLGLQKHDFW